mmetsp:Transcript_11453/g.18348  ORF Transcript_11453/g.18348 Transcript_11453/m.18348 type:complete len:89 (+) Transcript_11453:247-513(+)
MARNGYHVLNPCHTIKIYHVHSDNKDKFSTIRGHSEGRARVPGPYRNVHPLPPDDTTSTTATTTTTTTRFEVTVRALQASGPFIYRRR